MRRSSSDRNSLNSQDSEESPDQHSSGSDTKNLEQYIAKLGAYYKLYCESDAYFLLFGENRQKLLQTAEGELQEVFDKIHQSKKSGVPANQLLLKTTIIEMLAVYMGKSVDTFKDDIDACADSEVCLKGCLNNLKETADDLCDKNDLRGQVVLNVIDQCDFYLAGVSSQDVKFKKSEEQAIGNYPAIKREHRRFNKPSNASKFAEHKKTETGSAQDEAKMQQQEFEHKKKVDD